MGIPFEKACALHSHLYSDSVLTACVQRNKTNLFWAIFYIVVFIVYRFYLFIFRVYVYVWLLLLLLYVDDVRKERKRCFFILDR